MLPERPAFYLITHIPTGRYYAGSTNNVRVRLRNHKTRLQCNRHGNERLQATFTTWVDINVDIELYSSVELAVDKEQRFLDEHVGNDLCCNIGTGSKGPWLKGNMAEGMKTIISKANTGLKRTPETLARMRQSHLNYYANNVKVVSLKQCRKVSIDRVVYPSIKAAAEGLCITRHLVHRRLRSANVRWRNWVRIVDEVT